MSSELYLTEYERERQKKIEENKRLLETLGILESRSVLDASAVSLEVAKPKRNYVKRPKVQLEPRRSERVSVRPSKATSYAESDESASDAEKPKPKARKLSSFFSVRKTMWKPFYGQEIATCHICLVRNRQPKTKCSRCYADYWRGHVCKQCYETNFSNEEFESFEEARENPNWVCFVCRGICTCKFCRVGSTKRGKRYTKKRPMDEEEANALVQSQGVQVKEERDDDDGQFAPKKRGRGRPPKSRLSDSQLLLTNGEFDDYEGFVDFNPVFDDEGCLDSQQLQQLEQFEQLEQLEEQLSHLEQLEQLEQLEMQEREQERLRAQQQEGLGGMVGIGGLVSMGGVGGGMGLGMSQDAMLGLPQKRGRGRPPKNQQQQQQQQKVRRHQIRQLQQRHKRGHKGDEQQEDLQEQDPLQVHVKQEPLLDDTSLLQDPSSLLLHDHMLHDHMLLLPEHPMLHEHILQDIPPPIPMIHAPLQPLQDISQDHGLQDQLFRDHTSMQQIFRQPYPHNIINSHPLPHHSTHPHNHTHSSSHSTHPTHSTHSYAHSSLLGQSQPQLHQLSSYGHFSNILNTTSTGSLLLDPAPLYQHSYFLPQHHTLFPPSFQPQTNNHDHDLLLPTPQDHFQMEQGQILKPHFSIEPQQQHYELQAHEQQKQRNEQYGQYEKQYEKQEEEEEHKSREDVREGDELMDEANAHSSGSAHHFDFHNKDQQEMHKTHELDSAL